MAAGGGAMKTVAEGKVQHTINCPEETWLALTLFRERNGIADYGQAIQALTDFFLEFKDQLDEYRQKKAEAERTMAEVVKLAELEDRKLNDLTRREQTLRAWEQAAADERGIPYLPVVAAKSLLETGLGVQDILDLHKMIQTAGMTTEGLSDALRETGGLIGLARQLKQEVDNLTAQRTDLAGKLADERIKAADELAAAKSQVRALEKKAKEYQRLLASTDEHIAKVREFADQVEQTYRMLGLVLHTVLHQQFTETKASRIEHFPLRSLLFLAGAILTVAEETYGDRVFEMRVSRENMVPIRIRLSEIPGLFAPAEAYRAQKELLFQQMELSGTYEDQNGTGDSAVMGDA